MKTLILQQAIIIKFTFSHLAECSVYSKELQI